MLPDSLHPTKSTGAAFQIYHLHTQLSICLCLSDVSVWLSSADLTSAAPASTLTCLFNIMWKNQLCVVEDGETVYRNSHYRTGKGDRVKTDINRQYGDMV